MSFENAACCDDCWWTQAEDGSIEVNGRGVVEEGMRLPYRIRQEMRQLEFCHFCGWTTYSGIYVRTDTTETPAAGLRVRKESA